MNPNSTGLLSHYIHMPQQWSICNFQEHQSGMGMHCRKQETCQLEFSDSGSMPFAENQIRCVEGPTLEGPDENGDL